MTADIVERFLQCFIPPQVIHHERIVITREHAVLGTDQDALPKARVPDGLAHEFDLISGKSRITPVQEKTGGNKTVKGIPDNAEFEIRRYGPSRQKCPCLLKRNMAVSDGGYIRHRYNLFAEQRLLFPIIFSQVRPERLAYGMGRRPWDCEEDEAMSMRDDHCSKSASDTAMLNKVNEALTQSRGALT